MQTLLRLRQALYDKDISLLMDAYNQIPTDIDLGSDDVLAMSNVLTYALGAAPSLSYNAPKEWTRFADILVQNMRSRRLPPNYSACYNILLFYDSTRQFDRGAQFWAWLVQQDDTYNSPHTYAAAIRLLAKQGRLQQETEALFVQALQRFPSNFAEYHLSPNAVLQDRGIPSMARDTPMVLLSAIVNARLLQGNSKDAYLGLDTAFRISPERLPLHFYTSFIEERPVTEAYKVFQLGTRCGAFTHKSTTRTLLNKLRLAAMEDPMSCASLIRATLTVITQNVKLGASSFGSPALVEIISTVVGILYSKTWSRLSAQQLRPLTDRMDRIFSFLFEAFGALNMQPNVAVYNTLILNFAGRGKRPDILYRLLQDVETRGLKTTAITHRAVMRASVEPRDAELHSTAWHSLVQFHEAAGDQPRQSDWRLLCATAVPAGNAMFARQQLKDLSHTLTEEASSSILEELDSREKHFRPFFEFDLSVSHKQDIKVATKLLDQISADVAVFSAVVRDPDFAGLSMEQIPLNLGHTQAPIEHDEARARSKALYDELTSDSSSLSKEIQVDELDKLGSQAPVSASGVPYTELRFRNWQVMNELMAEAEIYDQAYNKKIDTAMSTGTAPPDRSDVWLETTMSLLPKGSVGLSDYIERPREPSSADQVYDPQWSATLKKPEEVRRLRGNESDQV